MKIPTTKFNKIFIAGHRAGLDWTGLDWTELKLCITNQLASLSRALDRI